MSSRSERRRSSEGLISFNYTSSGGEILMELENPPFYRNQWRKFLCKIVLHLITVAMFPIFGLVILKISCEMPYRLAEAKREEDPGKYEGFLTFDEFMATAEAVKYMQTVISNLNSLISNPVLYQIYPQLVRQLDIAQKTFIAARHLLLNSILLEKQILSKANFNPNFYQNEQLVFGAWISMSFFVSFSIIGCFLIWKHGISKFLNSCWTSIYVFLLSFLLGVVYAGLRVYWDPFHLDEPIIHAISNMKKNSINGI